MLNSLYTLLLVRSSLFIAICVPALIALHSALPALHLKFIPVQGKLKLFPEVVQFLF